MLKGMQFRIYPNKEQQHIIQKTFGCTRVVYNCGLALRINEYKNGNSIGYKETNAMLTSMKHSEDYVWLKEVDSVALQQSLRDLDKARKRNETYDLLVNLPKEMEPLIETCAAVYGSKKNYIMYLMQEDMKKNMAAYREQEKEKKNSNWYENL